MFKVTKSQGFTLSSEETFFEKPQGGIKLTPRPVSAPPPTFPAVLGLMTTI